MQDQQQLLANSIENFISRDKKRGTRRGRGAALYSSLQSIKAFLILD